MYGLALHGASAAISTCDAWASSLAGLGKKQGPQHLVKSDPVPFLWRPFSKCPGVRVRTKGLVWEDGSKKKGTRRGAEVE